MTQYMMPTEQSQDQRKLRPSSLLTNAFVLWFTGFSGAGKSTTASALQHALNIRGHASYLLDGDCLRQGLCNDLGFTIADRQENTRRISEVAALMVDAGLITLVAAITPLQSIRETLRSHFKPGFFIEVFVDAPLSICELRDSKGLYCKARLGQLPDFTGIGSPYERPTNPEIHLHTDKMYTEDCVTSILTYLEDNGYIVPNQNR